MKSDKRVRNNTIRLLALTSATQVAFAGAAQVEIIPSVGLQATYTDNVSLENSNKESSTIGSLYAGLRANVEGNDGSVSLDYRGTQAIYSHDSDRNDYYNSLQFQADKALGRSGFSIETNASVDNVARSQRTNANDDILTGDTVTTRRAETELRYDNGGRGYVNMEADVGATIRDASDDEGNSYQYSAGLTLEEGRRVDNYFWLMDYSFDKDDARDSDRNNQSHRVYGDIARAQVYGFSPVINYNWEKYEQKGFDDGSPDTEDTYGRIGPGVRYYIDRLSYVELNYNFVVEGAGDDYWGASSYLQPTRNTTIELEYSKRVFGDTYDVSIEHENRRLTNRISYTEDLSSFERDFFVEDEIIEDYSLRKVLDWTSTYTMRRGSLSLSLTSTRRERNDTDGVRTDDDSYGATLSYSHSLTRTTQLTSSFQYSQYKFDEDEGEQTDHYRQFDVSLRHSLVDAFSVNYGYRFSNRSSNVDDYGYEENRVFVNVNKSF